MGFGFDKSLSWRGVWSMFFVLILEIGKKSEREVVYMLLRSLDILLCN